MQGDRHYDYDAYGNLIRERRGTGQKLVTEYRYDCQHRLIGVSLPDGSTASYKYDVFGRRIEKSVDGHTTEFLWQGERLIAESAENRYRSYIYEPGSFRPLAMLDGEGPLKAAPFYYQLDHLGTPQELTDYSGEIMWSAKYRAYGNLAALDVSEIDNPLRFQGQYFDAETGLHYNRHRYYNPGTGRFLTPDPIKLAGGLNSYQYVTNPTGWVDPLGNSECPGAGNGDPRSLKRPEETTKVKEGVPPPPIADRKFKPGEDVRHFEKHGEEIGQTLGHDNYTLEQYVADANSVIRNGTFAPELNAFVAIPGGIGSAKGLLVGVDRATGEITTMHLKSVSFFETKAPSLGWKAQPRSVKTDTIGSDPHVGWKYPYGQKTPE